MGAPVIDMTGKRYGRWSVLRRGPNMGGAATWVCRCLCGTVRTISGSSLRRRQTSSCLKCAKAGLGADYSGSAVREMRMKSSLTAAEAARRMGVTRARWYQYEATPGISPALMERIREALDGGVRHEMEAPRMRQENEMAERTIVVSREGMAALRETVVRKVYVAIIDALGDTQVGRSHRDVDVALAAANSVVDGILSRVEYDPLAGTWTLECGRHTASTK